MAERLIYADLLKKDIDKTIERIAKKQGGTEEGSFAVGMCLAFKTMIGEQPTIEAKPVVHAHWVWTGVLEEKMFICSHCGECAHYDGTTWWTDPFCWNCGATMNEVTE